MTQPPTVRPVTRRSWLALGGGAVLAGWPGCVGADEGTQAADCDTTDATEPIDIEAFPGWDEPPHDIERQERNAAIWDEHYLGACLAREPTLSFDVVRTRGRSVLPVRSHGGYWVGLATNADEAAELFGELDPGADLDQNVLVAVQSPGTGSFRHRWARVEPVDGGIHLHGYYERPYGTSQTNTTLESVVVVERPTSGVDVARVSLTTSQQIRIHLDTDVSPVDSSELDS